MRRFPAVAMDQTAFFGVVLSPNLAETPEGYLLCRNAVIGRTGTQKYRRGQLPQAEAMDLGIPGNPEDLVTLHRDAEDVFDPAFIASMEGKPVTDGHPPHLLTLDTVRDHELGHMQNVRAGAEALDSGDMPLLADLLIKDRGLKSKILSGLRHLSSAYSYHIALDGDRILMVDMTGNHCAVLRSGRAGPEGRIYDGLDDTTYSEVPVDFAAMIRKALADWRTQHGATSTPADRRAAAAMDIAVEGDDAAGTIARRLVLQQEGGSTVRTGAQRGGKTVVGRKARVAAALADAAAAIDEGEDEGEVRDRLHDTLDQILDKKDAAGSEAEEAEATAKEELKELLEEVTEDDDEDDDDEDDDEDDEEGAAKDGADEPGRRDPVRRAIAALDGAEDGLDRNGDILPIGGSHRRGAAAGMDAHARLRALRPVIMRSKDRKLRAAYDTAVEAHNAKRRTERAAQRGTPRGVQKGGAGYGAFSRAASGHARDGADSPSAEALAQQHYNRQHPRTRDAQLRADADAKK